MPAAGVPASVLVVCTANICRSPAAELLLRAALGDDAGVHVASAGVEAVVGAPVDEPVARWLRRRGLEAGGLRARQLEGPMVLAADLVLTMTAEQRAAVVRLAPAALRRTFTLRELAALTGPVAGRLPAGSPAERLAGLVREAPRARSLRAAEGHGAGDPDVEDPYRRGEAVTDRVLEVVAGAVEELTAALRPALGPPVTAR